jgi:5-deoxy-glucuronate isomerase
MQKVYRTTGEEGYTKIVDQANSDLNYIEMGWLRLSRQGAVYEGCTGNKEFGMNILSGTINISIHIENNADFSFSDVGSRPNPFSGEPTMLYIPSNSKYEIKVLKSPFEAAVYSTPSTIICDPKMIMPSEVNSTRTGQLNWTRFVKLGIGVNVNAQRLIIGETLCPSGNWTSYPPHKHDELFLPFEKPSEEIYSFHFDNPGGFAFIRLYTRADAVDPFDEAYTMKDKDIITIKRGYHPIAVAPGYKCCYLFCLAGDERNYGAWRDDADHAWIRGCETIIQGNEG